MSHHGSMAKELRHKAEQRLKNGELKVLVATASLELGIDIGDVELVCQLGSPRSIATFLQRAGRASHQVGGVPKARLFPLSRDELVECAALLDAVKRGELDRLAIPRNPLDVLAQQIVAEVAAAEWTEAASVRSRSRRLSLCGAHARGIPGRRAHARRRLYDAPRSSRRVHSPRCRQWRAARPAGCAAHGADVRRRDPRQRRLRRDPGAREPARRHRQRGLRRREPRRRHLSSSATRRIGSAASRPAACASRMRTASRRRFRSGSARRRAAPTSFRRRCRGCATSVIAPHRRRPASQASAVARLAVDPGIAEGAAAQLVDYLAVARAALGTLPTQERIVLERFFDESGGMQLVIHSPYGSRINRAWGLALRKRFCTKFNFELQAAATEDAIVLSLSTSHSFELAAVARYLHSNSVRDAADPGDARCADVRRALALDRRESRSRCRAFAAARKCPRRCSGCAPRT